MPSDKGNSSTKAWTPATLIRQPDNIISSDYARVTKLFVPSYEKECRPCMDQLMANEYQRIWLEERDAWAKNRSAKQTTPKKFPTKVSPVKSSSRNTRTTDSKANKNSANRKKNSSHKSAE